MNNENKDNLIVKVKYWGDNPEACMNNAIRSFSKAFRNSGLLQELMDRKQYEKPSVKKKNKHNKAIYRKHKDSASR